MKRFLFSMVLIGGIMIFPFLWENASAETLRWRLYDDFESGEIDTDKWEFACNSGIITVEGGRVRFEHVAGFPDTHCSLLVKKKARKIKGLRATVEVESCTGAVRGRLGALLGILENEDVYLGLNVRPSVETISVDFFMHQSWHNKFSANFEESIAKCFVEMDEKASGIFRKANNSVFKH